MQDFLCASLSICLCSRQARLSFLHCLYQRLLAGCVLIHHPQSILGEFTWQDLCDVITQQVDQLTSDLLKANSEVCFKNRLILSLTQQ